jgi:hypothetical protein
MLKQKLTGSGVDATYIEDVFSTYLFTSTPSTQKITNNIDLLGKGGLVWMKNRATAGTNILTDTARGTSAGYLSSDQTSAQSGSATFLTNFYSDGFEQANITAYSYTSWTFRKQPKFFDVVTYTGDGSTSRAIAHSLGSVPGCIIAKTTTTAGWNWTVYHRSLDASPATKKLYLEDTNSVMDAYDAWGSTTPTNTSFYVGGNATNKSGDVYVAYLFAHDAGGFGLTGTDNVISCGSFTADGSGNATVSLGYEPQWVMIKGASTTGSWIMLDTMRGWSLSTDPHLIANGSQAESSGNEFGNPTATGFYASNLTPSNTYIYMAIRRGPMKVPTDATKVFGTDTFGSTSPKPPDLHASFPVDFAFYRDKSSVYDWYAADRLRGAQGLSFNNTNAESAITAATFDYQNGWYNSSVVLSTYQSWMFRRAPSFFDEVCYTGTGSATTFNHNLGVVPELMIVKERDVTGAWRVYSKSISNTDFLVLNSDGVLTTGDMWNSTDPTSTVFSIGTSYSVNRPAGTFVNYLFATCPGVSKVGSYTGTGTTKQVDCGFAAGARFVLIKRTDSSGDWYVWDTARGIVSGNDPYLLLNSTAAEVTSTDYIDTYSAGFELSSTAPAALNASGGTYIFLAIA